MSIYFVNPTIDKIKPFYVKKKKKRQKINLNLLDNFCLLLFVGANIVDEKFPVYPFL